MSQAGERVYRQIRNGILDGTLAPGVQMREEDFAALCDVSRTPVREAFRRLEGEKLIERDRQRSFVRVWSRSAMDDVFALRLMVEPYIAEKAAQRIQSYDLDRLKQANARMEFALNRPKLDLAGVVESNNTFHEILLESTASDVLQMVLPRLVAVPIVPLSFRRYDISQLQKSMMEHGELIAAFESRDGEWSRAIMASHIHRARRVYFNS